MLDRYRRWIDRKNREIARDQHKSDPQFHSAVGLRVADIVGGVVYWPVMVVLAPVWWVLFLLTGLAVTAPVTLLRMTRSAEEMTGLDLSAWENFDWFSIFFAATVVSVILGYIHEQRNRLIAEGRLKSKP